MEKIDFSIEGNEKLYAICIGLNPAKAEEKLDVTNKRLISLLNKEYGGYYLFNIFPEITNNANKINLEDEKNIYFVNKLKEELSKGEYKNLDIFLFFGRTFSIPNNFIELIYEWISTGKKIYITTHNDEFIHPGSNAKIKKEIFKLYYLRKSTYIRVNDNDKYK